jgi:hypothetical protein
MALSDFYYWLTKGSALSPSEVDYHYEADHDGTLYRAPPFNG